MIPTNTGESLAVPKGTGLVPMIDAIHHNGWWATSISWSILIISTEKYWPDPYEFRPDRFLGDYDKDAYLPFSTGARACIGRRYVITLSFSTPVHQSKSLSQVFRDRADSHPLGHRPSLQNHGA